MIRDFGTSLIIFIVSGGVALAANSLRKNPISWIRAELPPVAAATSLPLSTTSQATTSTGDSAGVVTMETVLRHLSAGSATFIDAREVHEYQEGHLRGAMNLPSSAIFSHAQAFANAVPSDAIVIVYCGGGTCEASHNVSDALRRDLGFTNVSVYAKGWEEIESSGRFGNYVVKGAEP